MLKTILLLTISLLAFGCATPNQPVYFYDEIVVRNMTRGIAQDVTIKAEETNREFGCSNIAPRGECSTSFPKREYLGSSIQIGWNTYNTKRQKRGFVLNIPDSFDPAIVLRGVLELRPDGSIQAFFEQGNTKY